ncbi:hypothetical protein J3T65_08795 [Staphylococcus simiae]|uniref:hypothetical protein n=1 Tax=Staphylococcus simiae TaxID=308354 RepID=UPI001A97CF43|nr:hypothetical protein [Staphylococcus simiae]MBO1199477.1 hypothetical protein [Staphylococcus simiae]MBO1201909.1 hypothetical protein [Staphylococcus simiae]MBO1203981.1 hypothetical protein [Staphylococcus simiae]MBO1211493.1 hypothetical protein [Staphylococcus simiae]MBO1230358.1 hypothetical protein [Staphylococcus simiae]
MNYVEHYINNFLKATVKNNIIDYRMVLDEKLKNLEGYIKYLTDKKAQLSKLIDSLMFTLENKYIDIADKYEVSCVSEINHLEIERIKAQLNSVETDYARIEAEIKLQSQERLTTENECYLINYMNAVA